MMDGRRIENRVKVLEHLMESATATLADRSIGMADMQRQLTALQEQVDDLTKTSISRVWEAIGPSISVQITALQERMQALTARMDSQKADQQIERTNWHEASVRFCAKALIDHLDEHFEESRIHPLSGLIEQLMYSVDPQGFGEAMAASADAKMAPPEMSDAKKWHNGLDEESLRWASEPDSLQMMTDAVKEVFTPDNADELWDEIGAESAVDAEAAKWEAVSEAHEYSRTRGGSRLICGQIAVNEAIRKGLVVRPIDPTDERLVWDVAQEIRNELGVNEFGGMPGKLARRILAALAEAQKEAA